MCCSWEIGGSADEIAIVTPERERRSERAAWLSTVGTAAILSLEGPDRVGGQTNRRPNREIPIPTGVETL